MNEEIDEFDVYHQDFTTVSDWEVFIARIEEVLNEWRLSKSRKKPALNLSNKWTSLSEEIQFQNLYFTLSYHTLEPLQDSDTSSDGNSDNHSETGANEVLNGLWDSVKRFMSDGDGSPFPVSHWYGIKQYLVLKPSAPLVEEHHIKIVMSSVNIAFANIDCAVPFFVKVREHWQQCYLGIYEASQFRTNFNVIHLKRIPTQCSHLNGLSNLFKGKIESPNSLDTVQMAAKFSYELKDLDTFLWKQPSQINEYLSIDGFDVKKLIELPFGSVKNPLQNALLNVIWPKFLENAVIDSATYSDFDPLMAPTWTITLKMRDNLTFQLSEMIGKLMNLLNSNQLLMDVLGLSKSLGLVNPLHKITQAPITISKLVKAAIGSSSVAEFKGPISDELLMSLLYYFFPDAVNDEEFKYAKNLVVEMKQNASTESKLCSFVKTSPEDGLVWRLSIVALRLYDVGGLAYLAHLWYEFTQELQYRWQHGILIPGIADDVPNARTCLLHQKLQLLNCCIKRASENNEVADGDSSEDEFYDCSEEEGDEQPSWDKPVGRLRKLEDAKMKNGAPLYIPRTQDPAPKTEDQLEQDAELMIRLGDNAKASELRARMMSASLLSDMEAFKAANPGAELCDFVRWYSPRDWKPDDGGALGDRMLLPDNPWVETWNIARPVPAARQRRLFDETREAEQVLHFLRSRSISAVVELVLPAILRASAARVMKETTATPMCSNASGCDTRRTFEIAAKDIYEAEKEACFSSCSKKILGDSVEGKELDSMGRSRIVNAAGGRLPAPVRREFAMRVKDATGPQVMRAALAEDITIIGAFTEPLVVL